MRDSIEHTVVMQPFSGTAYIGSDDDKLLWFELGTDHQPPRVVLAGALFRKIPQIAEQIGEDFYGALIGETVFNHAIDVVGE
jgi:hypothetical protein